MHKNAACDLEHVSRTYSKFNRATIYYAMQISVRQNHNSTKVSLECIFNHRQWQRKKFCSFRFRFNSRFVFIGSEQCANVQAGLMELPTNKLCRWRNWRMLKYLPGVSTSCAINYRTFSWKQQSLNDSSRENSGHSMKQQNSDWKFEIQLGDENLR